MTTITVTEQQMEAIRACRVLIVEGEWDHDDSVGLHGTPILVPPADLVGRFLLKLEVAG